MCEIPLFPLDAAYVHQGGRHSLAHSQDRLQTMLNSGINGVQTLGWAVNREGRCKTHGEVVR